MNDLKAPIDTLKDKIEQLIVSHSQLTSRLKDTEEENAGLADKLKATEALEKDNEELGQRVEMLTRQLDEKAAQPATSAISADELTALKGENDELRKKLHEKGAEGGNTAVLEEENRRLTKELEAKTAVLAAKENEAKESNLLLKELGEKNKLHNLAQSIGGNNGSEGNEELKLIITDLVKEIDKCITLLGKNV